MEQLYLILTYIVETNTEKFIAEMPFPYNNLLPHNCFLLVWDEKLQDVLGHFQKEFEGGVSAETLALPSILAQHKSPVKVANHNISKSPYNSLSETGNQSAPVQVAASIVKAIPESGMQPIEKTTKRDKCSMECVAQNESISKSVSIGDPGSLKVRIKVRPGNVLARNNPDIYSDLGLDVSPSPSLDDSPCESRELSLESPDTLCGSPSTILQMLKWMALLLMIYQWMIMSCLAFQKNKIRYQ
ncbi:hypothetical protein HPP92_000408 [Vanilla planifolia]|uniref:Uncharacterized protein n=1 Tax=Vanilla planifolia TaxID=51239 RepID=A0A835S198_VANPL|nr:hypothetical protein HPP92_000408 [Vanilla planifolia]